MKLLKKLLKYIAISVFVILLLNIPLKTKQGVDHVVHIKTIPLYLKFTSFLYRDFQYKRLSERIVYDIDDSIKKVDKIYSWTIENVRKQPPGFPIIDDHIWNIIVRGYGSSGQTAEVFTTLSSYAGYESFWVTLQVKETRERLVLSFVRIEDRWHVFDLYNRKKFDDNKTLKDLTPYGPSYESYMQSMDNEIFEKKIRRSDRQKLFPRIVYEIQRIAGITDDEEPTE